MFFLFPSFREGLPVAVMEAMASGLPVVCGKIRDCADLVMPDENGYFFELKNLDECAKKLEKAIVENNMLAVHNKRKAEVYSLNSIMKKYESVYKL